MCYLLLPADIYPDRYWFKYHFNDSPDHLSFKKGTLQRDWAKVPRFHLQGDIDLDRLLLFDWFMTDGPDLIGPRLSALIRQYAPQDVQLIDADVTVNGEPLRGFQVPNITTVIDCLDMEESTYVPLLPGVHGSPPHFISIVFRPHALEGHGLVRSNEDISLIVASAEFAEACRLQNITGIRFQQNLT
ncbi:imm11 family protein [Paenibacillus campi]|uniref:imm11 family protein n=1 Tax=Paenibacillus campi TaxID=3106031 RepID=UPI002AFF78F8|nr:DUF1629 domain-containing protein [Paenibacillus sp. SGZ-1014]